MKLLYFFKRHTLLRSDHNFVLALLLNNFLLKFFNLLIISFGGFFQVQTIVMLHELYQLPASGNLFFVNNFVLFVDLMLNTDLSTLGRFLFLVGFEEFGMMYFLIDDGDSGRDQPLQGLLVLLIDLRHLVNLAFEDIQRVLNGLDALELATLHRRIPLIIMKKNYIVISIHLSSN